MLMKRIALFLAVLILYILPSVGYSQNSILYESKQFRVLNDRVEQGEFTAKAISPTHIISDYQSPARTNYSSTISFKFSINGGDNEAIPGQDHHLTIRPENGSYTSPVITFGAKDPEEFVDESADKNLPPNTKVTIRVDMSEVMRQFEKKGYYTTYNGDKIPVSNFKGVYIAGGSAPLSWDFDNLANDPDYKLQDNDGNGIFKTTIVLNPHDPDAKAEKEWKLHNDISQFPSYTSDQLLVDALYNMSLDETVMNMEDDGTFRTGAKWPGVWTRDISYSVLLSYAFLKPEISKASLMRKVKRDRIIQDTGSGGAWPVSTDRVVWSLAAWEVYKVTGDRQWLKQAYTIIKNSLEDDLKTNFDNEIGLFRGESSFLDWREQSYPEWMDNADISQSMNLGTNAVYHRTFKIMSLMAKELDKLEDASFYSKYSARIKKSMNVHLWNGDKKYYDQYLYGRYFMDASPRFEALGESLSMLFGIADSKHATQLVSNAPVTPYGIPTFYPQIPNIPPYHNNSVWPFVQSFWNWANAAKTKNEKALVQGLASLYRPAALFVTNKENFVADNGDFIGTQINSDRQLWSVAGDLAMVYRVFLGMSFDPDRMVLNPTVPEAYGGTRQIKGFKYRKAILDFEIKGYGDRIKQMLIDGKEVEKPQLSASLEGHHSIKIMLNNHFENDDDIQLVDNKFSPPAPRVGLIKSVLSWKKIEHADSYSIYRDGKFVKRVSTGEYTIPKGQFGQYKVLATGGGGIESFLSEPIAFYANRQKKTIEVEDFASRYSGVKLIAYNGQGAVEVTKKKNTDLEIPFRVDRGGRYLISFRYSNGSGPWNTDNKCAIRTLFVDNKKAGTLVLPQRGKDEWSNWGISNRITVELTPGHHQLQVRYEPSDENMNGEVNRALLDQIRLVRLK
jgi:hypothetical protein